MSADVNVPEWVPSLKACEESMEYVISKLDHILHSDLMEHLDWVYAYLRHAVAQMEMTIEQVDPFQL